MRGWRKQVPVYVCCRTGVVEGGVRGEGRRGRGEGVEEASACLCVL